MPLPLEAAQSNFIDTINDGPDALDPNLFDGPQDRIMLGLAAHANTISHARLVALEETFPLTRQHIGDEAFNQLSRAYTETAVGRASDGSHIGAGFPHFIANDPFVLSMSKDDLHHSHFDKLSANGIVELSQIEWAWLESYNAAEAEPLALSELGGINEAKLLSLPVELHPSVRVVEITAPLSPTLDNLSGTLPAAILALRPDADVRLMPLDAIQLAAFKAASQKNAVLGNLLGAAIEIAGETAPLGPVMDLIGAGALVKTG